ncbi:probable beta-D-xylosidase 7 isoform X1 [Ziziphus jujuba]|uniref:Probable beta-D-xylosidase 7 isoform X1 n=1 Tax=Ziziphus jujuba TaxID=326968 RepID=A0A6P3ZVF6_ZIZJJ|nr:probable beta-D-xylosidase 7 isoform X1 [Ziziphus jujuba]
MKLFTLTSFIFFFYFTFLLLLSHGDSATESSRPPFACDTANPITKTLPFCNMQLPITMRVWDLISRLTLDEKIDQLVNTAAAIPRLGIPAYEWWQEALHGVSSAGPGIRFNGTINATTSFPQVILTAATFDYPLWYRIAKVIGIEARGVYNSGQAKGMTYWSPNVNLYRDPRWGRGQETPGEDPFVAGKYAEAFVKGLQGDSLEGGMLGEQLQASACCKHLTAYDLENWNGVIRQNFNAKVTQQDLADTFQPPFKACVEKGKATCVMCAFNSVNGVPDCVNTDLLTNVARKQWNLQGYIASDCDSVSLLYDTQEYAQSPEDAVADALNAGMDLDCGTYVKDHGKKAVEQKKLAVGQIDRALINLFTIRMRLGLFDGDPTTRPYGEIGADQVCSQDHQNLAIDVARNGMVLLKNSEKLLPLPKENISLAVIGPNAYDWVVSLGDYAQPPCVDFTPLQAFQSYVNDTVYHKGCDSVNCTVAKIDEVVEIAKKVDYVVLVMGLDQSIETEQLDRVDLVLPGKQQELIDSVANAAKKPVVLVLLTGGPVDITSAKNNPKIGGILWAGYPGGGGSIAIANIIFGDHNPGGRLPVTWYPQSYTKYPLTDMRMRPEPISGYPGRTYRFYRGPKVYEFGYGLSYSTYSYEIISVTQNKFNFSVPFSVKKFEKLDSAPYWVVSDLGEDICKAMSFTITVGVTNHGDMAGKHSVLVFVRKENPRNGDPIKQLAGFASVNINAGEKVEVELELNPCERFSSANEEGQIVLEEGPYVLLVEDLQYHINVPV